MANYDRGDSMRFTATIIGSAAVPADASTIYFLSLDAGNNRATHQYGVTPSAIIRAAAGAYYIDVIASSPGQFNYRWEATGGLALAQEAVVSINTTFKL